jgi:hypothetical protein
MGGRKAEGGKDRRKNIAGKHAENKGQSHGGPPQADMAAF